MSKAGKENMTKPCSHKRGYAPLGNKLVCLDCKQPVKSGKWGNQGFLYTEGHGFTYNHQNCKKCRDVVPHMLKAQKSQILKRLEGLKPDYYTGNNEPLLKKSDVIAAINKVMEEARK